MGFPKGQQGAKVFTILFQPKNTWEEWGGGFLWGGQSSLPNGPLQIQQLHVFILV